MNFYKIGFVALATALGFNAIKAAVNYGCVWQVIVAGIACVVMAAAAMRERVGA